MANGHGGARPNAGRKPNAVVQAERDLREQFAAAWGQDGVTDLALALQAIAAKPEVDAVKLAAVKLALEHLIGRPTERVEHQHGGNIAHEHAFSPESVADALDYWATRRTRGAGTE